MFRPSVTLRRKPASTTASRLADIADTHVANAAVWVTDDAAGGVLASYKRLSDELYRYFYARTRSAQDAEDLLMDVFVQAWRYRLAVKRPESWLRTVAKRTANRFLERRQDHAPLEDESLADPRTAHGDEFDPLSPVIVAFFALRENDRVILLLHGYEKRKISEVAQLLDISEDAAWQRWQQARTRFAKLLIAVDVTPPTKGPASR